MKASELRAIIKEEIQNILTEDAFRRIVITSQKAKEITKELELFTKRPEMKRDYPVKLTIKPGVKPDTDTDFDPFINPDPNDQPEARSFNVNKFMSLVKKAGLLKKK